MKDSIVVDTPNRDNWQQFCEEPELTAEEWALWYEIAALARQDDAFCGFMLANVLAIKPSKRTKDWSDVVKDADASRQ